MSGRNGTGKFAKLNFSVYALLDNINFILDQSSNNFTTMSLNNGTASWIICEMDAMYQKLLNNAFSIFRSKTTWQTEKCKTIHFPKSLYVWKCWCTFEDLCAKLVNTYFANQFTKKHFDSLCFPQKSTRRHTWVATDFRVHPLYILVTSHCSLIIDQSLLIIY